MTLCRGGCSETGQSPHNSTYLEGIMQRLRYFIFDLDGTLIDSSGAIIAALQQMEEKLGLPRLPMETLRAFLGPPLRQSLSEYYHVPLTDLGVLEKCYRESYIEAGVGKTVVFDGVCDALQHIRAHGGKAGLATLKLDTLAAETLRVTGLGVLFDHVALNTGSGVGDKVQLIRECLESLGCTDVQETVMFGDSAYDGRAAQRMGMPFVPLVCGPGFAKEGSLTGIDFLFAARSTLEMRDFIYGAI